MDRGGARRVRHGRDPRARPARARAGRTPKSARGALGIVPYVGTPQLAAAIGNVGCGCELAVKARAELDAQAREVYAADAPAAQKRWRCPAAGSAPDARRLDAGCLRARADAARLAGCDPADLGPSCPLFATRLPWVHRVVRARRWAERGLLREYVGPVSAPMFDAIDALDDALGAKDARDAEERDERLAAQQREAEAARSRGRTRPPDE